MRFKLVKFIQAFIFITLWVDTPIAQGKEINNACPLGFTLVYTKDNRYCLRSKGRETFSEKFKDCAGNLFNLKLYNAVKQSDETDLVWTGYKSVNSGRIFIDWSYTRSIGQVFRSGNVTIDSILFYEEELCLVVKPDSSFKAVKCNEKHQSFCIVKPYVKEKSITNKGCDGLNESLRFWSPESTCLSALTGVSGSHVRATWNQAQNLCTSKGGSLLNRGWRYSNYPRFSMPGMNRTYPLGIIMSNDYSLLRYDAIDDHSEIPRDEWSFGEVANNTDTLLGSLHNEVWALVNGSYIFYNVICEHSVPLRPVEMVVAVHSDKLTLKVNDTLDEDDITCFTDTYKPYPVKIKINHIDGTNIFLLRPEYDGYYWCTHINTRKFKTSQSNKALYIREKKTLDTKYAVKLNNTFKDDETKEAALKEFILSYNSEKNVITKELQYELNNDPDKWQLNMKLKKLYTEDDFELLHIDLLSDLKPPDSEYIYSLVEDIVFMRPVYYCKAVDSIQQMSLGESVNIGDCLTYSCVGDFNEGVQIVTSATPNCTLVNNKLMAQVEILMPTVIPTTTMYPDSTYHDFLNDDEMKDEPNDSVYCGCDDSDSTSECSCIEQTTLEITTTEMETPTTEYSKRPTPPKPTEVVTATSPPTNDTTTESITTVVPTTTETVTTATTAPEEQLQQILDDLDSLINGSSPIMVDDISDVFNQVDNILEGHDSLDIPGQLLHLLDRLGARLELNGSKSAATVRDNIALLIADASPSNPVRGLKIATRNDDVFSGGAFEILAGEPNSTTLDADKSEVVVNLPPSVSVEAHRISFVVFRNDRAFQSNDRYFSVNSRVLSIKVGEVTNFADGEVVDIHLSPMTAVPDRNVSRTCAYWEFAEDGTGFWSQAGCTFIRATGPGMLDTCRCTHLTHFAEVLFPRSVFSQKNEDALELLTIIGCALSLIGLVLVAVTAATFRSWRRDFSNKIWLQLCVAIFLLALTFLIIVFAKFDHYDIFCMLMGIVLHYSVLASFCWMLVAAVLSYRRLVLVFTRDASHKLLRASAFAWGAPCAVIGVLLSIDPHTYEGRFEEKSPSGSFCYPSGLSLWLSVYAPIAAILLVNWTLFALIVRSVFASRSIQRHGDSKEALRCASVSCLLVFLFGLPWIFGLFAFNIVAAYLFTITATFQGFMLFLFFVLGNKKTRDLWLNKLKIKQTRKIPVTSSTYSNRSTGWRGVTQGMTEVKVAKPKSLGQDDSRFS